MYICIWKWGVMWACRLLRCCTFCRCKCKSLHSCIVEMCKMCYYQDHISLFYTRSKVQSARYRTFAQRLEYARMKTLILHHSLCARWKVQDLAHLDTFKYQFLIKTLFLHHPLHSRCKVQDLAYLHTCKYQDLINT